MFHARIRLIVGVLVILLAGSAVFPRMGVADTGNELLENCQELLAEPQATASYFKAGSCMGFVSGIVDVKSEILTYFTSGSYVVFEDKMPSGVTLGQVARVVVQYLEDHPARLHEPAHRLVLDALRDAWGD